jgi:catechol 2,3-dioxygenase-like lactoylglutathione lyase family enzyme
MRLDHIAYRVRDRYKTAQFFIEAFNYRIAEDLPEGFDIQFEDGTHAKCLVLLPPEQLNISHIPWTSEVYFGDNFTHHHMAPEIFISDGSQGSIVKKWVEERNGIGGIHHLAYQVDSVEDKMNELKKLGYVEFTTDKPLKCPGLVQVFTKPSELTGIIYEFITREKEGFCKENVKNLMNSTKDISVLLN